MQDTLFERSAQPRAGADELPPDGDVAGDAPFNDTNLREASTIEEGIAETLSELDDGDSGAFDLGAVPLDEPDVPRQILSAQRSTAPRTGRRRRRRHGPAGDWANRMLLAVMLVSALLALVMVSVAYTEGFIP